ncbi:manganese-binding transcriptional regulator MntR [Thalassospira sp. TSL5-1]|uniref:manganese-binding transcriptional regulator MntR n=1 Tax=Thalassospira sp. TSL5-1 TaxID=1544451 RepID=UPI00093E21B8|nr:manganese-binding transcriptional regulator MntR [Thalassospira sp. TSL5-1]OKH87960.1 manganese transporter [Thalassospira sp. TSL5-1]
MAGGAALPSKENHAETFARLRDAHAREVTEDYVEMIADLIVEEGEARAVSLAERFGVTPATVNNTIKRLERDGFVSSRPYRSIFLTEAGQALADKCRERHQIVYDFLIALGLDAQIAEFDAEGIEHHVSAETLEVFRKFTEAQKRKD